MAVESPSPVELLPEPEAEPRPEIAICESAPGKSVFLESENADGWIATDLTVDVTR